MGLGRWLKRFGGKIAKAQPYLSLFGISIEFKVPGEVARWSVVKAEIKSAAVRGEGYTLTLTPEEVALIASKL